MSDDLPLPEFLASLGKTELKPGGTYATGATLRMLDLRPGDHVMVVGPHAANTALFVSMTTQTTTEALVRDDADKVTEDDAALQRRSTAKVGSEDNLPFADNHFSAAMIEATLSFQHAQQQQKVLSEVARVLKPGGRVGLHELVWRQPPTDALGDKLRKVWRGDVNPCIVRGWWDLLDGAGFEDVASELAVVSYFTRRGMIGDEGDDVPEIFHNAFEDAAKLARFAEAYREFTENRRYYGVIIATATKRGSSLNK